MATATLSKAEEAQVERGSESFSEPTMSERFETWAERVISHGKQEEKENRKYSGPREISMKGRSDEELEFIKAVGQKDESAKESRRENSAEKEVVARTEQRSDAKENEKPDSRAAEKSADTSEPTISPSEPLQGDRHWQEGGIPSEKELADFQTQLKSRAQVCFEYVNKHPEKAQILEGYRHLVAGQPLEFVGDVEKVLAEVSNPGEVIRHIALHQGDREFVRNVKDWKQLRAAIHTVSKHYAAAAPDKKAPEVRPRAPKPPSEVGGRGAAGDDGTRGETSFANFSRQMDKQYARSAR